MKLSLSLSSLHSPFSDGVGLPLHNSPSSGVLMKSIRAEFFLRPDALPGVNHKGNIMIGVYLDMKKAFDTVDHNIVLLESEETYLNGLKLIWVHKSVTFSCVFMLMQLNKCVVYGSDLMFR